MISIASTLILTRVDPQCLDFLSEYLDEKFEEYLGFRREFGRRKTRVSRSVRRKGGALEVVMTREKGCWWRRNLGCCTCETSRCEGKTPRTASGHMIIRGHALDELCEHD